MKQKLGLYFVVFILGVGAGYAFTPEYSQMRQEKQTAMVELGQADAFVDLRYVNAMIAHHLSAIHMAEQALSQSKRKEIIELSNTIIESDKRGIEQLYAYKRQWYGDTSEVRIYEKTQLGTFDELFDLRFLNALVAHHQMAIESAREITQKSRRNEVLSLANEVQVNLGANTKQLVEWRTKWYEN